MSDNKEEKLAGDPVEEAPSSEAEVNEAVSRATEQEPIELPAVPETAAAGEADTAADAADVTATGETAGQAPAAVADTTVAAADTGHDTAASATETVALAPETTQLTTGAAVQIHSDREAYLGAHTASYSPEEVALAAAAAGGSTAGAAQTGDKLTTIDRDHPMAAFYLEAPMPPEKRGNRGAGFFIALLATLTYALLYAVVIALFQLQYFGLDRLLVEGVIPHLLAPGYWFSVAAFFISLVLLVLIVGRAGWWAYVLGGFWVGVVTWLAAGLGYTFSPEIIDISFSTRALLRLDREALGEFFSLATALRILVAGVLAREVTVWYGAWIGSRGRKITAENRAAQAEYEAALAAAESRA